MGSTYGLHKYAKYAFGINEFGLSGKASEVMSYYGFTSDNLVSNVIKYI